MRTLTLYSSCLFLAFSSLALGKQPNPSLDHSQTIDQSAEKSSSSKISPYMEKACQLIEKQRFKDLIAYLEREDVQKDPQIQTLLGDLHNDGKVFEQSYSKAAIWWERAALQGNAKAQAELADLYFYGRGVEQDNDKGMHWL